MALPKAPDIPMPKPDDEDYMKVWHKYLQSDIDNYQIKRERDTWRKAFYAVAVMLFAFLFTLLVLCGSKLATAHFASLLGTDGASSTLLSPLAKLFTLHSSLFI